MNFRRNSKGDGLEAAGPAGLEFNIFLCYQNKQTKIRVALKSGCQGCGSGWIHRDVDREGE
jgi:hypothetical protein